MVRFTIFMSVVLATIGAMTYIIDAGVRRTREIQREHDYYGRGIVVRICLDGTRIYRYNDGSYWTALGVPIENPDIVCDVGIRNH